MIENKNYTDERIKRDHGMLMWNRYEHIKYGDIKLLGPIPEVLIRENLKLGEYWKDVWSSHT